MMLLSQEFPRKFYMGISGFATSRGRLHLTTDPNKSQELLPKYTEQERQLTCPEGACGASGVPAAGAARDECTCEAASDAAHGVRAVR